MFGRLARTRRTTSAETPATYKSTSFAEVNCSKFKADRKTKDARASVAFAGARILNCAFGSVVFACMASVMLVVSVH
jgi:hypothetical protein